MNVNSVKPRDFSILTTNTRRPGMTMQPGDSLMLNRLLMESYDRLSNSALSQDYYVHPVLAAYRIIGDDGAVLYRSTRFSFRHEVLKS